MVTEQEAREREAREIKIRKWMEILGHEHAYEEIFDFHALGNSGAVFNTFVNYMVEQKMKELTEKQKTDGLNDIYK
jgi:hypothetical protein